MARTFGGLLDRLLGRNLGPVGDVGEAALDLPPARPLDRPARGSQLPPPPGPVPTAALLPAPPPHVVDAHTRTFWSPGAPRSETLVEDPDVRPGPPGVATRVAALLDEGDRLRRAHTRAGGGRSGETGPSGPAFCELMLVELLRQRRFDRAFELLAPDCRLAWGSVEVFGAEHAAAAQVLLGAEVVATRRLAEWVDEGTGHVHHNVAELEVEYAVAGTDRVRGLRRTVHCVRAEGGWRSLVYPAAPPATPR